MARPILPNWLHLHIGRCVRRQQSCAKRCMDALNVTIVFCLNCICSRSTRSMPAIAGIDREADAGLACFRDAVKQLSTIPGVSELSAQVILSEIGTDMGRFATAAHLRSWAGLCPRNDESAGKRRSTRLRRGAPWLKAMLVQCAWAAARTKATYLNAQFVRLRTRRGPKKAVCAVAASILTAAYHMLKDGTFYEDLGAVHFDRRRPETQARRLVKRLAELGFSVELKPAAAVS